MRKHLLNLFFALLITGCTTVDEIEILPDNPDDNTIRAGVNSDARSPYLLSNVQEAYDIVAAAEGWPAIQLEPTDLYVRFLVTNNAEYDILDDSLGLELFDYPLDRKLTMEQKRAFAADDSDGGIWQYTKVLPGFKFPTEVLHEVLDEVYLPRATTTTGPLKAPGDSSGNIPFNKEQWNLILNKSKEITGNLNSQQIVASSYNGWIARATIMYQSDYVDSAGNPAPAVPLQGVKVRASNGLDWTTLKTNHAGHTGQFLNAFGQPYDEVDYKIIWDDNRWNIRSGRFGQAETFGPDDVQEAWNKTFTSQDGEDGMYATCHKALWNYNYANLPKTRGLSISGLRLNIGMLYDEYNPNANGDFNFVRGWYDGCEIFVWGKANAAGDNRPNYRIESTLYHELGHASHWAASGAELSMLLPEFRESFANAVEYAFISSIYPDYICDYYKRNSTLQQYTGIGEWLMLNGITLDEIESCIASINILQGAFAWDRWRNNTKALGIIDDDIVDILFDDPWTLWRVNFRELIPAETKAYTGTVIVRPNPIIINTELNDRITFVSWDVQRESTSTGNTGGSIGGGSISWGDGGVFGGGLTGPSIGVGGGTSITLPGTPAYYQIVTRDSDRLVLNVPGPGKYNIRYNVTIAPDGERYTIDYSSTGTINVTDEAYIDGENTGEVGSVSSYNLHNRIAGNVEWRVQVLLGNTSVSASQPSVPSFKIVFTNDNQCKVAYFKPGSYKIIAVGDLNDGTRGELASYNVSVSSCGTEMSRMYSYKNRTDADDIWLSHTFMAPFSNDGKRQIIGLSQLSGPLSMRYDCTDKKTSFYTFVTKPSTQSDMVPIYELYDSGAYFYRRYGNSSTPVKFYVYSSQANHPGTVPLYSIQKTDYGGSVTMYVTTENVRNVNGNGGGSGGFINPDPEGNEGSRYSIINEGIIGYVFPI